MQADAVSGIRPLRPQRRGGTDDDDLRRIAHRLARRERLARSRCRDEQEVALRVRRVAGEEVGLPSPRLDHAGFALLVRLQRGHNACPLAGSVAPPPSPVARGRRAIPAAAGRRTRRSVRARRGTGRPGRVERKRRAMRRSYDGGPTSYPRRRMEQPKRALEHVRNVPWAEFRRRATVVYAWLQAGWTALTPAERRGGRPADHEVQGASEEPEPHRSAPARTPRREGGQRRGG